MEKRECPNTLAVAKRDRLVPALTLWRTVVNYGCFPIFWISGPWILTPGPAKYMKANTKNPLNSLGMRIAN
jgi:hypothetical protein